MTQSILQHTPLIRQWPHEDSALTVFRYALAREACRGKRVLEIGAAAGEGTLLLADADEIVAVDHQDLWSGSPAASLPNVRFVRCDAMNLSPEWEGQFDVVVALELIEHLADPAAFQREMFRVLADGGRLILSTPNFDIYSAVSDASREPLYCHHVREYRAAELEQSLLDIWSTREISGISQLAFSGEMAGVAGFPLLHGERIHDLTLDDEYPNHAMRPAGTISSPLPLDVFQSFWVTLGKGLPSAQKGTVPLSSDEDRDRSRDEAGDSPRPVGPPLVSAAEAAFRSCQVILRRKNQHIRYVEMLLADRQRHAGNLEDIVADREARLTETEERLRRITERLLELEKWLPYRVAQWTKHMLRRTDAAAARNGASHDGLR